MKKFNVKTTKGEWLKFLEDEEVELNIRPFSLFSLTKVPSEETVDMTQLWNIFNYCLIDWKGIEGETGPMECNEENKKIVYDYDQQLVAFVVARASELRDNVVSKKEIKN